MIGIASNGVYTVNGPSAISVASLGLFLVYVAAVTITGSPNPYLSGVTDLLVLASSTDIGRGAYVTDFWEETEL